MTTTAYLSEYELYDGEAFIIFNVVDINIKKNEILLAVTNRGGISLITYDLLKNNNGLYFEFGCEYTKIYLNDFEEVK
jgi:hypothetical protein